MSAFPDVRPAPASRAEWHEVLLRLAGQLTDDDLVAARAMLAQEREDLVAQVLRAAVAPGHIELPEPDQARLLRLLAAQGITDADGLVGIRAEPGLPRFGYSLAGPGSEYNGDAQEQAVTDAARQCGVRELYRVWRVAPVALLRTLRVYLAKADAGADLAGIAGRLQEALLRAGDPAPQVEVYSDEAQFSAYQREAYESAETLWLDGDPGRVRMAALFDGYGPDGTPFFSPGHERVDDPAEREILLGYLGSGVLVEPGGAPRDDVVDRSRRASVPDGLRSDGEWVWPEGVRYYLEHYRLAPDPALRAGILSAGAPAGAPGDAELRNVRLFLIVS